MKRKSPENTDTNTKRPLNPGFVDRIWKPGECGNPGGRPKTKLITLMYDEILNDPIYIEAIKIATVKALKGGNMAMVLQLKEMADRTEGKVTQKIDADVSVNLADVIAEARKRAGR